MPRLFAASLAAATLTAVFALNPAIAGAKPEKKVCGPAATGEARCFAHVITDANGKPEASSNPALGSYGPSDLVSAYGLPALPPAGSAWSWNGQTVAIVDAYDDPYAASNLATYRSAYGLPPCNTGCFAKVNQAGNPSPLPRGNTGWAQEISLDLDMVSATCPGCKILLVEASNNQDGNLYPAVRWAAAHANAVSNSWGGGEYSSEASDDQTYFNHPGVAITVSSGDSGYGAEFPASSQFVTAVGGTSLNRGGSGRAWTETAWSGAGSGCSLYIAKPKWQTDPLCSSNRTVADVSADADPNTGVAVYDTFRASGWYVFGGTSVASPIIASVYALAGNTSTFNYASYPYGHSGSLWDITSGSNGNCGNYLCTAGTGYDGPTGLGTPNGTGAF